MNPRTRTVIPASFPSVQTLEEGNKRESICLSANLPSRLPFRKGGDKMSSNERKRPKQSQPSPLEHVPTETFNIRFPQFGMAIKMRNLASLLLVVTCTAATNVTSYNDISLNERTERPKDGRFITLDSKDGEVRVELDFTIPFLKIPVGKSKTNTIEPSLIVNPKTLVTAGAMMMLLVTIVPKIVQLVIPQAEATSIQSFMPLMGKLDETLRGIDVPLDRCYQRSACWVATNSFLQTSIASSKSGAEWLGGFIENKPIQEAFHHGISGGDCSAYSCPVSMNTVARILSLGRKMMKNDT